MLWLILRQKETHLRNWKHFSEAACMENKEMETQQKNAGTALVLGATGLVGGQLVRLLLADGAYEQVRIFVRRKPELQHPRLQVHIVDFDRPETWQQELKGTVLFSTLGTTLRQAGSQEAQYRVDYTYQYEAARAAANNGVGTYVLVSSAGADAQSRFFYSRIKGELDRDVQALSFANIRIIRPSVLDGNRQENRTGEGIALKLGKWLAPLIPPLKKYRPIHAATVARAMIQGVHDTPETTVCTYTFEEVFALADAPLS